MMRKFLDVLHKPYFIAALLGTFVVIAVMIHTYKITLPCLNSDEAAFGYNAYSISQTGKDEYGSFMPLRFKSFGENKLPLMAYLTVPFIKIFGLNDFSTRAVAGIVGILSPVLFYFLTFQLTKNKKISLIAAFLSSISIWIQMTSRHAHEAILAYGLLMISLLFLTKYIEKLRPGDLAVSSILLMLALFSHHISKIFVPFFFVSLIVCMYKNRKIHNKITLSKIFAIFLIPLFIFLASELAYPTNRIENLLFFQNKGFELSINELNNEHPSRILHNKLTYGLTYLTDQYLSYFSPEFLVVNGDENPRFGYKGLSPITVVEFVFLIAGIYFLFKNKERHRYFLIFLLLVSPLSASLSWQEHSLTRSFFMIVPILIIAAYGVFYSFQDAPKNRLKMMVLVGTVGIYFVYIFFSWDFYFNHYFKKPLVIRAWQCGYQQLGTYVKDNYNNFDTFYITRQHGQPYIYMLYYLKFPPEQYQMQAKLTPPDVYGFGQVEKFDKFVFSTDMKPGEKGAVMAGYPQDFTSKPYSFDQSRMKKITVGTEDIFWIYDNAK